MSILPDTLLELYGNTVEQLKQETDKTMLSYYKGVRDTLSMIYSFTSRIENESFRWKEEKPDPPIGKEKFHPLTKKTAKQEKEEPGKEEEELKPKKEPSFPRTKTSVNFTCGATNFVAKEDKKIQQATNERIEEAARVQKETGKSYGEQQAEKFLAKQAEEKIAAGLEKAKKRRGRPKKNEQARE